MLSRITPHSENFSFLCRNDGNVQSVVCLCVSALSPQLSPALLYGKLIFIELEERKSKYYTTILRRGGGIAIYQDAKRRAIYLALWADPEGDSSFSIYQISWMKIKKKVNKRRHLQFFYVAIESVSGIIFLWFCCKFSENFFFLQTLKRRQAKWCLFLGICWSSCFIYS